MKDLRADIIQEVLCNEPLLNGVLQDFNRHLKIENLVFSKKSMEF